MTRMILSCILLLMQQTGFGSPLKYANQGPFQIEKIEPNRAFTVYKPQNTNQKIGALLWGNGSGMRPSTYQGLLKHFATWGVIVVASNSSWDTHGTELEKGTQWLRTESENENSEFYQLHNGHFCAAGHSRGGAGARNIGRKEFIDCTALIQPGPKGTLQNLAGPTFIIAGEFDPFVSPSFAEDMYVTARNFAVFGVLLGEGHSAPMGSGTEQLRHYVTSWVLLHVAGAGDLSDMFYGDNCEICKSEGWLVQKNQ